MYTMSMINRYLNRCRPGSSVGLATGYGLDGSGSNPGGGEIFRLHPDRPWGPPSLLYNGYRVFPGGKVAGAWCWPHSPFYCRGHESMELYLYPTSGPVQACNGTYIGLRNLSDGEVQIRIIIKGNTLYETRLMKKTFKPGITRRL
jgi:hypothetical protein